MAESLINLEPRQFESLIETQGLDGTVEGIVQIATEDLGLMDQPITVESLKSELIQYWTNWIGKRIAPEDRQLSSEEILTLFTNVEDYGKFDPDGSIPKLKAFAGGVTETIPKLWDLLLDLNWSSGGLIANLIPAGITRFGRSWSYLHHWRYRWRYN